MPADAAAHLTVERMRDLLDGVEPTRIRTIVVASGSPAQGLHELAADGSASLLVVGSTHTGHVGRVHPGSTGERLLAGTPCDVAVVPLGYRTKTRERIARVGVAYDGSAEARVALDAGIAAARAFNATIEVISVIPTDVYGSPALMFGGGYVAARADVERGFRKDLDAVIAALPWDVAADSAALKGRPIGAIAQRSEWLDLLLIGSRGYGPLRSVMLGGTSGPLLRARRAAR